MRLRPHHLLDIIAQYGTGVPFQPSDYGHAVHTAAKAVITDPEVRRLKKLIVPSICRTMTLFK
jgi:hypothetical protein